jgi:prepilin-type N-terminal cleavage/methylation domain-containing protein
MSRRLYEFCVRKQIGFTLIELVVVSAIIGILAAILLPAIQSAREAARTAECKNNLKQISISFWNHEAAHRYFPTGGWGFKWVGDPDSGYGPDQPGGWAYNILAYLDQEQLRMLGRGIADRFIDPTNPQRQAALLQLVSTPLPVFNCPSKRPLGLWPYAQDFLNPFLAVNVFSCTSSNGCRVARGDYRVNSGNKYRGDQTGPGLIQNPDTYPWQFGGHDAQNGISYQRSMVRVDQITDGTGTTAMVGEKYLNPNHYFDGEDPSDDQCAFIGHDRDNSGYTANGNEPMPPRRDEAGVSLSFRFGGPHASGLNMAFCDRSVRQVAYDVDAEIWGECGGRNDGGRARP